MTFAGLQPPYSDYGTARAVVAPVAYDGTMEWRTGARHGPRAIIEASQYLELFDLELGREVYACGIHTLPEASGPAASGPEAMTEHVRRVIDSILADDKLPVMLGGEHSLTVGAVKAIQMRYPDVTVLQLDAHSDLRDEYMGSRFSNACVTRRLMEMCRVVQAGIRSSSQEEQQFLKGRGIQPVYMEETTSDDFAQRVSGMLGETVYVSIDLDVFDPSVMPAVGTPEPGGMNWEGVLRLLKEVMGRRRVAGFDIMELCPQAGLHACDFLAAKLAYKMIGYSLPG